MCYLYGPILTYVTEIMLHQKRACKLKKIKCSCKSECMPWTWTSNNEFRHRIKVTDHMKMILKLKKDWPDTPWEIHRNNGKVVEHITYCGPVFSRGWEKAERRRWWITKFAKYYGRRIQCSYASIRVLKPAKYRHLKAKFIYSKQKNILHETIHQFKQ